MVSTREGMVTEVKYVHELSSPPMVSTREETCTR
jgi:hypothetical protein